MTFTPTPINQLSAGGAYPHEDCGESCVLSIAIDYGSQSSVADIENWDTSHGDWPGDGTGGDVAVGVLATFGLSAHVWGGDTLAQLRAAFGAHKQRVMIAIYSDTYGKPQAGGPFGHWLLAYGLDEGRGVVQVMQPVGGYLTEYSIGSIQAAQQQYGVTVDTIHLNVGPPTPVSAGSNNMWIAKKLFLMPNGSDGYLLDGWGGIHPVGLMPQATGGPYWPGQDIARDIVVKPDGSGGYVLDGYGGIHPFAAKGAAPPKQPPDLPYWNGLDVAVEFIIVDWDKPAGYTFDGWGGATPWGGATHLSTTAYWPGGKA